MTEPTTRTLNLSIAIVIEPDERGFHAFCPALKGLHVDGSTEIEALENARQAILVYLDSLCLHGDPLPVGPFLAVKPNEIDEIPAEFVRNLTIPWPTLQTSGIN